MNIAESRLQCDLCANVIAEDVFYLNNIIAVVHDCNPIFYLGKRLIACPKCVENIKIGKPIRDK